MPSGPILVVLALLGVGAGVSLAVQAVLNTQLRVAFNSSIRATLISYVVGTIAMVVASLAVRETATPFSKVASAVSWPMWLGGFFGAVYIFIAIILIPRLGSATVFALVVAGQMFASLVIDHNGWFNVAQHAVDAPRLLGAALLIVAVVLIRL